MLLTSGLDGGEWSASSSGHFTPRESATGIHLIESCVDPRAGLDVVAKRKKKNTCPYRDSKTGLVRSKGKGKVVPVPFLNRAPQYEGVLEKWRYSYTHSLTPALDGGEWSASRPSRFTPRERAPGTNWIGSCVDPRAGLDAVVKRKFPSPYRDSSPRSSSPQPSAVRWVIPAPRPVRRTVTILTELPCHSVRKLVIPSSSGF
jgi:hypothetical protein